MADPVLFLSRPASEGLASIHALPKRRVEPVWKLVLTAAFAAGAALTCAGIMILGAPDGDAPKGDPVHMVIGPR
jgi:hypothetical protein